MHTAPRDTSAMLQKHVIDLEECVSHVVPQTWTD